MKKGYVSGREGIRWDTWFRWRQIRPHYMNRFHILPANRYFNIYLHRYVGPDDLRFGLHDHPWHSFSIVLKGLLFEMKPMGRPEDVSLGKAALGVDIEFLTAGCFKYRKTTNSHAITQVTKNTWTLFITGPVKRKWGFWTPVGWVDADTVRDPEGKAKDEKYLW